MGATRRRDPPSAAPGRHVHATAAVLGLLCFLLYLSNCRMRAAGDTIPNRVLPFSLLREGDLDLDEFTWPERSTGGLPYYVRRVGEHVYPGTTVVTGLLVTPLYILPAWLLARSGIPYDDVRARLLIVAMERVSAALLTALSVSLLFALLDRRVPRRWAVFWTLVYALGTNTWVTSSQALWPHAGTELALVALSWCLLDPVPSTARLVVAGTVGGLAVANRPQFLGFALLAAIYVWRHHRKRFAAFAAIPGAAGAAVAAYNFAVFGKLAGAYGSLHHFDAPLLEGLAGLLVSPNRGLLVYSPVLALAFWGAVRVWRTPAPPWLRYLSLGVLYHLLLYGKFSEWWAGFAYGPRYMTDVLPALCLLGAETAPVLRGRPVRVALVGTLAAYSFAVQAVGVYCADDGWNREPVPVEVRPERVWDWHDWQVTRALRAGWHGSDLAPLFAQALRNPVGARLGPLEAPDLAADVRAELPTVVRAGHRIPAVTTVTNRGGRSWPAFTGRFSIQYEVFLVARWLRDGRPVGGVGAVRRLPVNVAPGQTVRVPLSIEVPAVPGLYELEVRVTQARGRTHGVSGPGALRRPVRVEAAPPGRAG